MNAGFSNLATLKAHVLGNGLTAQTQFDTKLRNLGLGLAGLIETHCGRLFDYKSSTTDNFSADHLSWVTVRYPIGTVASVEVGQGYPRVWEPATSLIASVDEAAGLLQFKSLPGDHQARVRVAYSGGYWWDVNEDNSGTPPEGIPTLPADIVQAWLIQCGDVWDKMDKHGLGNTAQPDQFVQPAKLELLPIVKQMLHRHRRMQLS